MPPLRMETTDWVSTFSPWASSETSMPLAFQNRVFSVTRVWCGASTKIWTSTVRPSAAKP